MSNARTLANTINSNSEIVVPSGGVNFGTGTDGSGTVTGGVLDDYEEGTWTPEFDSDTGSFGNLTYDTQVGYYTKIGNLVTVYGRTSCNSTIIGTASGEFFIKNLPFANVDVSGSLIATGSSIRPGGPGPSVVSSYILTSSTSFAFLNASGTTINVSDLTASGRNDFAFTITYAT